MYIYEYVFFFLILAIQYVIFNTNKDVLNAFNSDFFLCIKLIWQILFYIAYMGMLRALMFNHILSCTSLNGYFYELHP